MWVIPVMDLLDGQVVRAVAGDRANYRPIRSHLADSAEPAAVAAGLLRLAPFGRFYLADLAAICHGGSDRHLAILAALCADLGRAGVAELWLDAGSAPWLARLAATAAKHGVRLVPVAGAESLAPDASAEARYGLPAGEFALSVDYRSGRFLGPAGLDGDAAAWPRRVVVMELAAVGAGRGPALQRLDLLRGVARAAGRADVQFFAAGGVRHAADLDELAAHGAAGVLVASALHDGVLDAATLSQFDLR